MKRGRYIFVTLLLALISINVAVCEEETNEMAIDTGADIAPPADSKTTTTVDDSGAGAIVGQSHFPQLPWGFLNMFPCMSQLFSFPRTSLLGSTQDRQGADSKVILVLAEDPSSDKQGLRTPRQNAQPSFQQLLQQAFSGADILAQAFPDLQQQDLAQITDLSQATQLLGQAFSAQTETISQALERVFGITSQSNSAVVGSALESASGEPSTPNSAPSVPAFPAMHEAIANAGGMLGQALGQFRPSDSSNTNSASSVPGFPGMHEAITNAGGMLSQALGQFSPSESDNSNTVPSVPGFPAMHEAITNAGGMLGQALGQFRPTETANSNSAPSIPGFPGMHEAFTNAGGMLGQALGQFKPLQPWPQPITPVDSNPVEAQASEISEVRVKPDFNSEYKLKPSEKMDDIKYKAALQELFNRKKVPILWFRLPSKAQDQYPNSERLSKSIEDKQIETKLRNFEHQIIAELRQLQELERQAKALRSVSKNAASNTDPQYKLNYSLSKTPIHKITREDVERSLNDDYIRKLLEKSTEMKEADVPMKRQTMASDLIKNMSKEDIMRMMAYAYRMANSNDQKQEKMPDKHKGLNNKDADKESEKPNPIKVQGGPRQSVDSSVQKQSEMMSTPTQRQWVEQNMDQHRKMTEQQALDHHRQLSAQNKKALEQMNLHPMEKIRQGSQDHHRQVEQQEHPHTEHDQWIDEQMKMQSFNQQPDQRQWVEQQMKMKPFAEQLDQRQWIEPHMNMQTFQQNPEQRQWIEQMNMQPFQQPMHTDQRQSVDQQRKMQPKQWVEKNESTEKQHQTQTVEKQDMIHHHQQVQDQRQWVQQDMQTDEMEKRQKLMNNQAHSEPRQWAEEENKKQTGDQQQKGEAISHHFEEQNRQVDHEIAMQNMHKQRQWFEQQFPEQRQMVEQEMNIQNLNQQNQNSRQMVDIQSKTSEAMRQMANSREPLMMQQHMEDFPQQHLVGEATPQMAENMGQARHKDFFDGLDIFEFGGHSSKKGKHKGGNFRPTVINYYYGQGGSRYPVYGGYAPVYGGYGGNGYGGYSSYQGYSGAYGGGGYGSNAYGSGDVYRSAAEQEEILTEPMQATLFRK